MKESSRDYQPTSHDEQAMLDRAQHTPGPWRAVSDTLVRGPHGEAVAMTRTRDTYPFDPNHAANARLIAAAPTMYDYVAARAASGDTEAARIKEDIDGNA